MSSLNKVQLIGHMGDDVKMHYFEGGGCIGRAPLATSSSYTNKTTGERVTDTEWHNLVFRNKGAELIEKYTGKGSKLYVEGRLKTRKWQDDQGRDRYSTEINVNDFIFLSSKDENQANQQNSQQSSQPAPEPISDNSDDGDDLPF